MNIDWNEVLLADGDALQEFMKEFFVAATNIVFRKDSEQLRRLQKGRQLQHSRWEKMGHKFVFTGLDGLIVTGKVKDEMG